MKKVWFLSLLISGLCSGCSKDSGAISGIVTVSGMNETVAADIALYNTGGTLVKRTTSQENGLFEFTGLSSGIYVLQATVNRYEQQDVHPVRVSPDKTAWIELQVDRAAVVEWIDLPAEGIAVHSKDIGDKSYTTFASIESMCKNSTIGGFTDWRLPDNDELMVLYNKCAEIGGFTQEAAWLEGGITNKWYPRYWSSAHYVVYFDNGKLTRLGDSDAAFGRCVRSLK